jgi:hypothetical protein
MLTTVLERLTTLASKHFIIGAFMPVLVFAFVNGVILYVEFEWFRGWADPQITGTARAFDAAALLISVVVIAHVLWSINGFLRQVLEGQYLRESSFLGRQLRKTQLERFRRLRKEYSDARKSAADLTMKRRAWTKALAEVALIGAKTDKNDYDGTTGPAAEALANLRSERVQANTIAINVLQDAVDKFKTVLRDNNINKDPGQDRPNSLSADRRDLLTLFDYAADEWVARELSRANELQARFGERTVAPTALGNVSASMQSYALTRYGLNLETFWSRLQPVLQKQQAFYIALQDAKVQLDFLVASVFLSALTTIVWVVTLPIGGQSAYVFLSIAALGPMVTVVFYRAAVENYVAFGEIVRTGIDLYRFELLEALHLQWPRSLRDERALWEALRRVTSFGQEWVDFSYQARQETKK